MEEIYDILKEEEYNVSAIDDNQADNMQDQFENDMDDYLEAYIKDHKKELALEYAGRNGLIHQTHKVRGKE